MSIVIRNRTIVRLKHKGSGKYLYSDNFRYNFNNTTKQQAVAIASDLDERCNWIIKGSHKSPGNPDPASNISDSNVVRFEHVATTKNLHSHLGPYSPLAGHLEVTCFGTLGEGDDNDDWLLELNPLPSSGNIEVTLRHMNGASYLNSTRALLGAAPKPNSELVTAISQQGTPDSIWILELVDPNTSVPARPLLRLEFGGGANGIAFYRLAEFERWLNAERDFWSWLWKQPAMDPNNPIPIIIDATFKEIADALQNARNRIDTSDFGNALRSIETKVKELYSTNRLIHPNDARARFVSDLAKNNPVVASYALGTLLQLNFNNATQAAARGSFAALAYEQGLRDTAQAERAAITQLVTDLHNEANSFRSEVDSFRANAANALKETSNRLAAISTEATNSVNTAKANFDALERAMRKEWPIRAAVNYWRNKAIAHLIIGLLLALTLIATGVGAYIVIQKEISSVYKQANSSDLLSPFLAKKPESATAPYAEIAEVAVSLTLAIWVLRIILKLMLSNFQQASDAYERVTMIKTFIALIREDAIKDDPEKEIILNALFRPGQTGLLSDDSGPATPMEIVMKQMDRSGKD